MLQWYPPKSSYTVFISGALGYFLPRLQNKVYQSRAEAYNAIDKFIEDFNKEKYFAGIKGILKPSMFVVEDAPKYRIESFESNDDYLDYIAYTG